MTIQVECGECGKGYRVKDELAGKKIRCSGCQGIISIPVAEEDEWDFDAGEEEEEAPKERKERKLLPPAQKTVRKAKKSRGGARSSSEGMPVTVILALVCLGLIIGLSVMDLIGYVITPAENLPFQGPQPEARKLGAIVGSLFRIAVQGAVFAGVYSGKRESRIWGPILGVLTCVAMLMRIFVQRVADVESALLAVSVILRVVFIVCVLVPMSSPHFEGDDD